MTYGKNNLCAISTNTEHGFIKLEIFCDKYSLNTTMCLPLSLQDND